MFVYQLVRVSLPFRARGGCPVCWRQKPNPNRPQTPPSQPVSLWAATGAKQRTDPKNQLPARCRGFINWTLPSTPTVRIISRHIMDFAELRLASIHKPSTLFWLVRTRRWYRQRRWTQRIGWSPKRFFQSQLATSRVPLSEEELLSIGSMAGILDLTTLGWTRRCRAMSFPSRSLRSSVHWAPSASTRRQRLTWVPRHRRQPQAPNPSIQRC